MSIQTNIETIGPDRAKEYLSTVDHQRRVTKEHVTRLTRSMESGHWRMTGEPIQFDVHGHLINGQHRMHAIVGSGTEQQFMVVRGLPPEAYEVMDQGRARTRGETLMTIGVKNATAAASSAAILVRMKFGLDIDRINPDNAEIMEFAKENRQVLDWATTQAKRYRTLPASTYGAALFLMYHANSMKAEAFAEAVATGANMDYDNPAMALRRKAELHKGSKHKLELNRTSNLLPVIIHSFNTFCAGKPMQKIVLPQGAGFYPSAIDELTFWNDK